MRAAIEIGDIFRRYGDQYIKSRGGVKAEQYRAIKDISACRTAGLGGHIEICDSCGRIKISYNSCGNRHCPKCQSLPAKKWLVRQQEALLPIQYYHLVFTMPQKLNDLTRIFHKKMKKMIFYPLFMVASREFKKKFLTYNLYESIFFIFLPVGDSINTHSLRYAGLGGRQCRLPILSGNIRGCLLYFRDKKSRLCLPLRLHFYEIVKYSG